MPFHIFKKDSHHAQNPQPPLTLNLGSIKFKTSNITNDYTISSRTLGVGINGKVVECFSKRTHQKYALKALRKTTKAYRECALHWMVRSHPNIVNVIDIYENTFSGTKCYLMVMECMEGRELFERIQAKGDNGFTEKEASCITRQICDALLCLHNKNIAHRDIKPENLLFKSQAPEAVLKLTDFGFASEVVSGLKLKTPCFTPYYAAPEVLGPEKYDMSCDMWSLGVIIYILLCGYPPFHTDGGAPMSPGMKTRIRQGDYTFPDPEWTNVSDAAKDLIRGLLCTDVGKRFDIRQCVSHPWIADSNTVPETPLMSARILNVEADKWGAKKEEMNNALNAMRIDYDNVIHVGDMKMIQMNNPILKRRQNMKAELITTKQTLDILRKAVRVKNKTQTADGPSDHSYRAFPDTPSPTYITPSNPTLPRPKHIVPCNHDVVAKKSKISRDSGSSRSSPYWSDWEDYTTGSITHDTTGHVVNSTSPADDPATTFVKKAENTNLTEVTPTTARKSDSGNSVSANISLITEQMKSQNTPEEFVQIMVALNLLGDGLDELHSAIDEVSTRQTAIVEKVDSVEGKMGVLESQFGLVHDKIDNICQDSTETSPTENSDVSYFRESSKL